MRMKVSNYISQKLVDFGITQVFTVTGGGAMHLMMHWGIRRDLPAFIIITSRHAPSRQSVMRGFRDA